MQGRVGRGLTGATTTLVIWTNLRLIPARSTWRVGKDRCNLLLLAILTYCV